MKPRRRVLVIARHFWPATTDDTLRLWQWICRLQDSGAQVTVATPRWNANWPRQIVCQGVRVQRIDYPPTQMLRSGRYVRQLTHWLSSVAEEFDAVYCDAVDLEATAVLASECNRHPLVVRMALPAPAASAMVGSRHRTREISSKVLAVCRSASGVIVGDARTHQQLLTAGLDQSLIVRAPAPSGARYDRTPEARRRARQMLSEANHDLFARAQDRVVVCPGELNLQWNVVALIEELAPLIEEQRSLRVWILGDGRARAKVYDALQREGLHRLVTMPGLFTDLEEVLQAADLCVFPAPGLGLGWLIPTCIASGISLLVSDSPGARQQLEPHASELLYSSDQPRALRTRVSQWLTSPTIFSDSLQRARLQQRTASGADFEALFPFLEASA